MVGRSRSRSRVGPPAVPAHAAAAPPSPVGGQLQAPCALPPPLPALALRAARRLPSLPRRPHPQPVDGQLQPHLEQQEQHAQLAQLLHLLQAAEQAAARGAARRQGQDGGRQSAGCRWRSGGGGTRLAPCSIRSSASGAGPTQRRSCHAAQNPACKKRHASASTRARRGSSSAAAGARLTPAGPAPGPQTGSPAPATAWRT